VEDGCGPLLAFGESEDVVVVAVAGLDACGPVGGGLFEAGDGAHCGVGEPADGSPEGVSLGPAAVGVCDDEDLAPGYGQRRVEGGGLAAPLGLLHDFDVRVGVRGRPPPGSFGRAVCAGGVYDDYLEPVSGVVLSVYVLQLLLDVPGLVVGGYGHRHGGEVGGVGLDAPGLFEPPPGGGVVGEGRAEVGGGQRGAEGGQEVHGVRSLSPSLITSRLSATSLSNVAKVCAAFRLGATRRRCGGGRGFLA